MRIAAVIPTLGESERIGACVAAVRSLDGDWEIVVVDGGSQDGTVERARAAGADQVLAAEAGRGTQLDAGARAAQAEVLLFLHADARLPCDAAERVRETLTEERWSGGAFHVRHRGEAGRPVASRLVRMADLRSRWARLPYGDQAIFTTRSRYERTGGFPRQPLMEDVEFARRLRRLGPIRRVPSFVEVSARRFEQRPLRTFLCWNLFPMLYATGVSPERLAIWYGAPHESSR